MLRNFLIVFLSKNDLLVKASENKLSTSKALLLLAEILKKTSQSKSKSVNSSVKEPLLPDVPGAPKRAGKGPKVTESNKEGFESLRKKLEFLDPLEFFTQILNKRQCPDAPLRPGARLESHLIRRLTVFKKKITFFRNCGTSRKSR